MGSTIADAGIQSSPAIGLKTPIITINAASQTCAIVGLMNLLRLMVSHEWRSAADTPPDERRRGVCLGDRAFAPLPTSMIGSVTAQRTRRDSRARPVHYAATMPRVTRKVDSGPAGSGALRSLVGAGPSQVGVVGALRARDVSRPAEADLARAAKAPTPEARPAKG